MQEVASVRPKSQIASHKSPISGQVLGPWGATAMIVAEVVGVGIFLTPAAMMRALGTIERALILWGTMGALTFAGALCYA